MKLLKMFFEFEGKPEILTIPWNYNKYSTALCRFENGLDIDLPSTYESISDLVKDYNNQLYDMCREGIACSYSRKLNTVEIEKFQKVFIG